MTDKLDLDELERLAKAATPGPWEWMGNPIGHRVWLSTTHSGRICVMGFKRWGPQGAQPVFQKDGRLVDGKELFTFEVCDAVGMDAAKKDNACYRYDIEGIDHPDAAFIAAANPKTILALIARVRELEWIETALLEAEVREQKGEGTLTDILTMQIDENQRLRAAGNDMADRLEKHLPENPLHGKDLPAIEVWHAVLKGEDA